MNDQKYDVIVIGTGPGGEGAAMRAAKDGKSVAVIEKHHLVGGGCGTVRGERRDAAVRRSVRLRERCRVRESPAVGVGAWRPDR